MLVLRVCLGLLLVTAGGCASAGSGTLAGRFVRQGVPAVDLGGPRPAAAPGARVPARLDSASITAIDSRLSSTASSLEAIDPGLRDAMFRLRVAPTPTHHVEVARRYRRLGILDTAHDYLTRSLAVNGPDAVVHDQLARLWRDWAQPGAGLAHAYQAIYLAPDWPAARNTLGTLLHAMGRRRDALARFEEVVRLDPEAAYSWQNLCVLYQAEGRTREAIAACHQADATRHRTGTGPLEESSRWPRP